MDNNDGLQSPKKRHADDNLDHEQRLSKRFNLLNLEHSGKLYIPIQQPPPPRVRRTRSNAFSDSMNVDDTRDRIYIHNLDEELSDAESEGEKLVFLPDIEKRLTKIPMSVLTGQSEKGTSNEVVLYKVPESLSVPPEQDNVRRAILDFRARARERPFQQTNTHPIQDPAQSSLTNGIDQTEYNIPSKELFDEDAMDVG